MKIKWNKIFDWTIDSISAPYEMRASTGDMAITAYGVDINYRHHGRRVVGFWKERDRILRSGLEVALGHASAFYEKMCRRLRHK